MLEKSLKARIEFINANYGKKITINVEKSKQKLCRIFESKYDDIDAILAKVNSTEPDVKINKFISDFYDELEKDITNTFEKEEKVEADFLDESFIEDASENNSYTTEVDYAKAFIEDTKIAKTNKREENFLNNDKNFKESKDEIKPISFENLEIKTNTNNNFIDDNRINNDPEFIDKHDTLDEIKLDIEKEPSKGKIKEIVIGKDDLKYKGTPAAPNLNNVSQVGWVKNLSQRAKEAKGRLSDSEKYKDFYYYSILVSDLAKQIAAKKALSFTDDAIIDVRRFDKKTQEVLPYDPKYKIISVKEALKYYKKAWNGLVNSAKEYEKFKIQEEGYTRNENDRSKSQLRSRSKMKFNLMDEIFDVEKRTIPEAKNSKAKAM
ncbi:MAG: hypothetical protein K6A23_15455 [Butyrivibrio sp.]|nr:hypothetical protein [Butyrivibrio sp.]